MSGDEQNNHQHPRQPNPGAVQARFLDMLFQGLQAIGGGYNAPIPVQRTDEDGKVEQVMTTPAQLLQNLTEAIDESNALMDEYLELKMGELEEQKPQRRRRKKR